MKTGEDRLSEHSHQCCKLTDLLAPAVSIAMAFAVIILRHPSAYHTLWLVTFGSHSMSQTRLQLTWPNS